MSQSKVIETTSIKIIAWVCISFFLLCTIGTIYSGQPEVSPVFIFFILLGVLMLIMSGRAEISYNGFKVLIPLGEYYISWNEVEYIETGAGNLILGGHKKRLCFPSFEFWNGKDKINAIEIFARVAEEKQLEIKETKRAILPIYRNTKINKCK